MADVHWAESLVRAASLVPIDAEVPDALAHGIEFENVTFSYPGTHRNVLERIHLRLPAGSTVATVGENGAGKSTLLKLLCGFYQCSEGVIKVDGVDMRRFPLAQWRTRIAAGFQDFAKFELPARETIGDVFPPLPESMRRWTSAESSSAARCHAGS